MNPSEFSSLVHDVALTAAAYSGGAGGTFDDAVQGADYWTVESATPSFETRAGVEGMLFSTSATQSIIAPMLALHEATVIVIAQPATGTQPAMFGSNYAGGNGWQLYTASNTLRCYATPATQAATASDTSQTTQPTVFAGGWSPRTGNLYAQINAGALAVSGGNGKDARINWTEAAIGRHRTSYFSGWISHVHVFSHCLPERDPDGFASLITNRMALVGL